MEKNFFLPIGSVVKIFEKTKMNVMIIGYMPESEGGDRFDYVAVQYPIGAYNQELFIFFNREHVREICHIGYENDEYYALNDILVKFAENSKEDA